jgi:hypothetical protein
LVAFFDRAVLGEVIHADDFMAGGEKFLDEISRDESGRAGD